MLLVWAVPDVGLDILLRSLLSIPVDTPGEVGGEGRDQGHQAGGGGGGAHWGSRRQHGLAGCLADCLTGWQGFRGRVLLQWLTGRKGPRGFRV